MKVLCADPWSTSCGNTTFYSKWPREFIERLHCPCQPRGNVLLPAKEQTSNGQLCFTDWWNLGPGFECLQGYFFWALFDEVSAFCNSDCHPFLLSSFQLSYHPIGMDTHIKTVNHERISLLFVILEASIKILSTSDTLMVLIYQHKNKYQKANIFALFWYVQSYLGCRFSETWFP